MSSLRSVGRGFRGQAGSVDRIPAPSAVSVRAAWTAASLFGVVAVFHAAVALGAPWGEYTQGGGTSGALAASGRVTAAVSCMVSLLMTGAILARVGRGVLTRAPSRVRTVLAWFTMVYAAIAVVLDLITQSAAERTLWSPVAVVLLALVGFVMADTRRRRVRG